MIDFAFVLALLLFVVLVTVASVSPRPASLSAFELKRRREERRLDEMEQLRADLFADAMSLRRILEAIGLVFFVMAIVNAWGWLLGGLAAIVAALTYGTLAGLPFVHNQTMRLYGRYERAILEFIKKHAGLMTWLRSVVPSDTEPRLGSKDELRHLVDASSHILSRDERTRIVSGLAFDYKTVEQIMTPKSVVETIRQGEILGPLVLDDLHKTGHSRFPVIDGDIDHVVGILHLRDVLTLDTNRKHTAKVETAMDKRVHYIRQDHTLPQALAAFLSTHHHMFIVINEFRETVGILTLEDVLESLIGRRIIDEFDAHDDMRAVAERNARSEGAINRSADSTDV